MLTVSLNYALSEVSSVQKTGGSVAEQFGFQGLCSRVRLCVAHAVF